MDKRLIRYYDRELRHIQSMAREFAREFPKIAGRLAIEDFPCPDPYVERLLEGFAFLAARVQLKIDAEFPRFTQNLLETVYPHYLAPTPSLCVVQLNPDLADSGLAEGFVVPRETVMRSLLSRGEQTACEYRTAHDIKLWPIRLVEARYFTRDMAVLELGALSATGERAGPVRAALRLRFQATAGLIFSKIKLDRLTLFFAGGDATPGRLYEQVMGHTAGIVARAMPPAGSKVVPKPVVLPKAALGRVGFGASEALLPYDSRSFQGYRLLHEYFAFPQRFLFASIEGLEAAAAACDQPNLELILLLDHEDPELESAVSADNVLLHCAPAANLFPKRADRIFVTDRASEFQVIPDRTRPQDFEVYRVLSVTGFGSQTGEEQVFRPFYSATDMEQEQGGSAAYYSINRVPRALSEREQRSGRRSSYGGSEVFVSLVDAAASPYTADLKQLAVETLCTNRDLPLQMPVGKGNTDFGLEIGAPVESIRVRAGPTSPRPSHAEGEVSWRLISHLGSSYLSLLDVDERQGAQALRDLLRLYSDTSDASVRKQVEAVRSVSMRPLTRRVNTPGPITYARGIEVSVNMDESGFEGTGVFVLGSVLEQFFARYVSVNSFTETVLRTTERGEIMRWNARVGHRPIF